jgi:hypothetical protein
VSDPNDVILNVTDGLELRSPSENTNSATGLVKKSASGKSRPEYKLLLES